MQLRRSMWVICAESILLFYTSAGSAMTLIPGEEQVSLLVTASPMSKDSSGISHFSTATPVLCGNTSAPSTFVTGGASATYFSPTGLANSKPFVFGASAGNPTTSAAAFGANTTMTWGVAGVSFEVSGDPSLVCYSLNAKGVHGPTVGVMRDSFEGIYVSPTFEASINSSVVLNVFHLPASPSDYYGYTIDVTIPAVPSCNTGVDCNFALTEGFDSSIFDADGSGQGQGQWCLAPAGAQSCASPAPSGCPTTNGSCTSPAFGDININYANYAATGISLRAPISPAPAKQFHFVAFRKFASNVTSLNASSTSPMVIAALFSPFDLDENYIGDNVAAGYANSPPSVVQSGDSWSVFSAHLSALSENTDSGTLSYDVMDPDTPGTINSTVTLNLNGLTVPVAPSCSAFTQSGAASAAHCTFDVNLSDPNWWNATVDPAYQGQGNVFATDPGGIAASAKIVVMDALGKASAPVTVPIHVQSKVNNAPLVAYGPMLPNASDPFQNGSQVATYSCSISGNTCGSRFLDITGAIKATPGPAAAFDELATQTTAVVAYTGGDANGGNVQCSNEQGTIFLTGGAPLVGPTNGVPGSFDVNLLWASPIAAGSAICTVTITDSMASFPAGETAQTKSSQFRMVVNP